MKLTLHPKQSEAFTSPATEILYGGAAGGGKSYYLRVSAIRWCLMVPGISVYLLRRTHPDLRANHLRGPGNLHLLLAPFIAAGKARWREQAAEFLFSGGATLKLAHLQHETDVVKYQGAEIHVLLIDELTHFSESQYRFLRSRVRRAGLIVPKELEAKLPRIECASNPGGIGHGWVKSAWITPQPPGAIWTPKRDDGAMRRQYIPARLTDNPTLMDDDPDYLARLSGLGTPELVRAMRDGDWDINAGQAFEMFRESHHVLAPFTLPPHWTRFRAMDWGSSKPFSIGWWAVSDGSIDTIPAGALVRYREWYGWNGRPDTGLRLTSTEVAAGILEREAGDTIAYGVADPAIFGHHDGPSVAEHMAELGITFKRAVNRRYAGFQEVRRRLMGVDNIPMLFVLDSCRDGFLRTVPDLTLDPDDPEDVHTTLEDHVYDETRYACMSRPQVATPSRGSGLAADRWRHAFRTTPPHNWRIT